MNNLNLEPMKKIKMEPVESSNIHSVGYDDKTKTLRVKFLNGNIYDYSPVEPQRYKAMKVAESVGSFFFKYIKSNASLKVVKL